MRYASKRIFMSSSTDVIPEIPKLFTSTLTIFGERNAGNVGPKWIFLTPNDSNANNTITAFCSYHAMLYAIGKSFKSSKPKASFRLKAIFTNE